MSLGPSLDVSRAPATAVAYREIRRSGRERRRQVVNARTASAIDRATLRDPTARGERERERDGRLGDFATAGTASLVFHVAMVLAAVLGARWIGAPPPNVDVPVAIRLVATPAPPAPAPEPVVPEPPPPPPVTEPKVLPVVKKIVETAKTDPIPPTPIEAPPPPPEPPKEPPRRIVGMSSTLVGGTGPAFAAGNTLMGRTSDVASDPAAVQPLTGESTPPRRLSAPRPEYPAVLREHGIEGAVSVRAEIDASGHVTRVTVVEPSPHEEFNRAAVDAATRTTYQPALSNGAPVARAIEFTVRFRLHD